MTQQGTSGIEQLSRNFYDTMVFDPPTFGGEDFKSVYWNTGFDSIVDADALFAEVDRDTFIAEMTAIQFELFALACEKRFKDDKIAMEQSVFTKEYLIEKDALDMWETMQEYNTALAESATMNSTFQQIGGTQATRLNEQRLAVFSKWAESGLDEQCIARVANRTGTDIHRADTVAIKRLAVRLADRLDCDPNLSSDALFKLAARVFGIYNGAEEYLKQSS